MRSLRYFGRLLRELLGFAWQNKAWWIVPVVTVLFIVTALIVISGGVPAFLYTFW